MKSYELFSLLLFSVALLSIGVVFFKMVNNAIKEEKWELNTKL